MVDNVKSDKLARTYLDLSVCRSSRSIPYLSSFFNFSVVPRSEVGSASD